MLPTWKPGSVVIGLVTNRLKPGDVVILRHGGRDKIKRIQCLQDDLMYVVGDNKNHSTDSRSFGWLPQNTVIARVVWPKH